MPHQHRADLVRRLHLFAAVGRSDDHHVQETRAMRPSTRLPSMSVVPLAP